MTTHRIPSRLAAVAGFVVAGTTMVLVTGAAAADDPPPAHLEVDGCGISFVIDGPGPALGDSWGYASLVVSTEDTYLAGTGMNYANVGEHVDAGWKVNFAGAIPETIHVEAYLYEGAADDRPPFAVYDGPYECPPATGEAVDGRFEVGAEGCHVYLEVVGDPVYGFWDVIQLEVFSGGDLVLSTYDGPVALGQRMETGELDPSVFAAGAAEVRVLGWQKDDDLNPYVVDIVPLTAAPGCEEPEPAAEPEAEADDATPAAVGPTTTTTTAPPPIVEVTTTTSAPIPSAAAASTPALARTGTGTWVLTGVGLFLFAGGSLLEHIAKRRQG